MYETLKMMKSILNGKEKDVKEEDLIREYQINKSPNILAFMYVNHFGIIANCANKYSVIDLQDKASFCLQELDKCLLNFNFDNKFTTYFAICYKNRLRSEFEMLNTNKRKTQFNTIPIDDDFDSDYYEIGLEDEDLILNQYNLSFEDKKICKFLSKGYNLREVAERINRSVDYVCKSRKKLKNLMLEV